ncbi:zf-HC2 domain-containing protein [Tissierella sp. MSJ-40]|uniref:Zf-HC2 domain-containing protein n=1 Tax=Tissierella simiarum TaxID=2841534 RepID=A0ABS6E7R6_9FIRM|nr:zf-HC2 domain-containing protein [Tissierella simiarum]MBU5438822.1 zf-HC2 domain-containing protein [Tissierella simiarum]
MDCSQIKYLINSYVDREINQKEEELLFEHIEGCEECKKEFNQFLDIDSKTRELFKEVEYEKEEFIEKVMNSITTEEKKNKRENRKFKFWHGLAAGLLLIILINNDVIAYVGEWINDIVIREAGFRISIKEGGEKAFVKEEDIEGETVEYESKDYNSLEEIINLEKLKNKPILPVYVAKGYNFEKGILKEYINDETSDFSFTTYYNKITKGNKENNMSIEITYRKDGVYSATYNYLVFNDEKAKVLDLKGENGVLRVVEEKNGLKYYILNVIGKDLSADIRIWYKGYEDDNFIEKEIKNIGIALVEEIKTKAPIKPQEIKNVSEVTESENEEDFYNKIIDLDDRIVKMDFIPGGFEFIKGTFIDNTNAPPELSELSSIFGTVYEKEDSRLDIIINYHDYTGMDSDFATLPFGEVERREKLSNNLLRIYKTEKIEEKESKTICVVLEDYATVISIMSTGEKEGILDLKEMKEVAAKIIDNIQKSGKKRPIIEENNKLIAFDNMEDLISSKPLKEDGLVLPTYFPKGYSYRRAKYIDKRYMLQLENKNKDILTISMERENVIIPAEGREAELQKKINILGYKGYIFKSSDSYNGVDRLYLEVDMTDKGMIINIDYSPYKKENINIEELIKIAESMVGQIKE